MVLVEYCSDLACLTPPIFLGGEDLHTFSMSIDEANDFAARLCGISRHTSRHCSRSVDIPVDQVQI